MAIEITTQEYKGNLFEINHEYLGGAVHPSLTGFGRTFVGIGFLRGYGYVRGGATGHFGPRVKGAGYEALRATLANGNLYEIAAAARRLPSVTFTVTDSYAGNPNMGGFRVSRKGCLLFVAAYLGRA